MHDAIVLSTEQIYEIREKTKYKVDPLKPVIAIPQFDLIYKETRPEGSNYILQYSWDEIECILEIGFRFAYDSKEEFKIYIRFEEDEEHPDKYSMWCSVKQGDELTEWWSDVLSTQLEESEFANWQAMGWDFLTINAYIAYHDELELFEIEEKVAKLPTKKSNKKKSGKNNTVRLYRQYTLKKDWQKAKKLKTPHKIQCGAWGVRGHFRHYKNGNTIFIKAYVKGKNKESYKGKEYKLIGDKNG